jgi:hypothetical protein
LPLEHPELVETRNNVA